MREIEIKLKVNNLDLLEKDLAKAGCVFSEPISQHDVVYSSKTDAENGYDSLKNSKEGHVAIRIRYEKNTTKLTLKQQRSNEMDNIEYETEVKDPKEIHGMLTVLGWKIEVEVKKTRKKGKLGKYEICLDKVERLGNFMEIEKMTDDNDDPENVRKELFEAAKPFGFAEEDEETRGYDTQIYQLENK